jgi:hypothetical protein
MGGAGIRWRSHTQALKSDSSAQPWQLHSLIHRLILVWYPKQTQRGGLWGKASFPRWSQETLDEKASQRSEGHHRRHNLNGSFSSWESWGASVEHAQHWTLQGARKWGYLDPKYHPLKAAGCVLGGGEWALIPSCSVAREALEQTDVSPGGRQSASTHWSDEALRHTARVLTAPDPTLSSVASISPSVKWEWCSLYYTMTPSSLQGDHKDSRRLCVHDTAHGICTESTQCDIRRETKKKHTESPRGMNRKK